MLDLVIDRKFFQFLNDSFDFQEPLWNDFYNMLLGRENSLTLYSDIDIGERDRLQINGEENCFLKVLGNSGPFLNLQFSSYQELLDNETFLSRPSIKIFFIHENKKKCEALRKEYGSIMFHPIREMN